MAISRGPWEALLCRLVGLCWDEEKRMGGMWLLDVVMEASELPPESLASFTGWRVAIFTEGRTMAEVDRGKEDAAEVGG